jgi:hypothetical protein
MKNGKESNYFEPLENKVIKSYEKVMCFRICGFVDYQGQN